MNGMVDILTLSSSLWDIMGFNFFFLLATVALAIFLGNNIRK